MDVTELSAFQMLSGDILTGGAKITSRTEPAGHDLQAFDGGRSMRRATEVVPILSQSVMWQDLEDGIIKAFGEGVFVTAAEMTGDSFGGKATTFVT